MLNQYVVSSPVIIIIIAISHNDDHNHFIDEIDFDFMTVFEIT